MVVHLFLNNNKDLDFLPINSIKNGGVTVEQIAPLNLKTKEQQLYVNKKTRKALTDTNKNLHSQIDELQLQLNQNTETLIDIIEEVKLRTNLKVDHLLAPHLLKRYLSK